jgi:hypothetical protein
MMLAKPEHIEPDLIGKLDFLDKVPDPSRSFGALPAGRIGIDVSECVKSEFHGVCPSCYRQADKQP